MAQVVEELLVFKISKLVKDNESDTVILGNSLKQQLAEVVEAAIEADTTGTVIVELVEE
jgi:hypothetical protein